LGRECAGYSEVSSAGFAGACKEVGATGLFMPSPDIYTALQKGTLDGTF